MRIGRTAPGHRTEDHVPTYKPRDVLSLATIDGARAARMDSRVGSLTPGKRADIVVLSCERIGMHPVNDPVASAVFYAAVGDVDTVVVDGKVVKRDGRLLYVDTAKLRADVERSRDAILSRARSVDRDDLRAADPAAEIRHVAEVQGGERIGPNLSLLSQFIPGYSVTWLGGLVGLVYGFGTGFVFGFAFARARNTAMRLHLGSRKLRRHFAALRNE